MIIIFLSVIFSMALSLTVTNLHENLSSSTTLNNTNQSTTRRIKVLGEGTYGKVICYRDPQTHILYARKIFNDLDFSMLREVDLYTRYKHPYMLKFYKAGIRGIRGGGIKEAGKREIDRPQKKNIIKPPPNVFVDLNLGTSNLFEYIQDSWPIPSTLWKHVLWKGLCLLDYLHKNDFIHRDIKPGNIIVGRHLPQEIWFGDFGAGRVQITSRMSGNTTTYCFRAPECHVSKEHVCNDKVFFRPYSGSSDIFSLGRTIMCMFVGNKLNDKTLTSRDPTVWRDALLEAKCPPRIHAFLNRLTHADPTQRATIAETLKHPCMRQMWTYYKNVPIGKLIVKFPKAPANYPSKCIGLSWKKRAIVIEWVYQVHIEHGNTKMNNILFKYFVQLLDDYLYNEPDKHQHISTSTLQCIACVCYYIVVECVDCYYSIPPEYFVENIPSSFSLNTFYKTFIRILKVVGFGLIRRHHPFNNKNNSESSPSLSLLSNETFLKNCIKHVQ